MSASQPRTVAELAEIVGGEVVRGDGLARINRVMPTDRAAADAVTFVTKAKYYSSLAHTKAAAVMLEPEVLARSDVTIPATTAVIAVRHPYVAFARAAQALAGRVPGPVGVHPSAVIEAGAELGRDVAIGPFVFIGRGAKIGDGATLYAGVHVEPGATVGAGSVLYNHVVVRHACQVGARCILHPGVVIGSDGFGFALDTRPDGELVPIHEKIPQLGDVVIEDDVEIGSNACVDRAALGTTRIGAGTKIDNLVQVGHNVEIGPGCILVAQSGVAGSSKLGKRVILGAQTGVSGHLKIGNGAMVLGQSGVMNDLEPNQQVMGSPAVSRADAFRTIIRLRQLDQLFQRVKKLERFLTKKNGSDG
jgi:UDP-3-O-[3-hydroxymyristoyl] glucosamine N-acyltransferase